jgi:peptide/nickel transport system permease protein
VTRFLLARLGSALLVLFGVSLLVFLLIHLIPGDPVEVMLGESSQPADRAALRQALGLDQPLLVQLLDYYRHLLQFNLGESLYSRRPIADILLERFPATLELAAAGLGVALLIALPLGTLAAVRRDTVWDGGAMTFSMLGISIPHFWLGPLLILVFSLWLGWLPVSGREEPASLVLPALTLGTALAAILARMLRATLLEVLGEDFIRTARAKGLSERAVIFRHALRNALLPVVTTLGMVFGFMLGSSVIIEKVFGWPGVGSYAIDALTASDYAPVQGFVLAMGVLFVLLNLLVDVLYTLIDPRVAVE